MQPFREIEALPATPARFGRIRCEGPAFPLKTPTPGAQLLASTIFGLSVDVVLEPILVGLADAQRMEEAAVEEPRRAFGGAADCGRQGLERGVRSAAVNLHQE